MERKKSNQPVAPTPKNEGEDKRVILPNNENSPKPAPSPVIPSVIPLKPDVRPMVRYRKVGGGSLRLGNHIIKPNEIFTAYPEDIPAAFRDLLEPLDEVVPAPEIKLENVTQPEYKLEPAGGEQWNLLNVKTGKFINETPMVKDDAEYLLKNLL